MIRPWLLAHRASPVALIILAATGCWSGASHAQSAATSPGDQMVAPSDDVIRLSDQDRKSIEDNQTVESAAAARGEMTKTDRAALGIHGEVGAMIGSNGTRGAYGTAAIPLGDHAGAVVSFESSRVGDRR